MANDINLRIIIDGKEAQAVIKSTDENVKELYKSFTFGTSEVGNFTTSVTRGMTNAFHVINGVKESFNVLKSLFAEPLQLAIGEEVLKSNFAGAESDLQSFRKAVAGTVSDAGLIKLSNQATDLGLSLQQQVLFFALAEDAADKYGGGVEANFNKLVAASEGAGKGLKSLGIQKEQFESILESLAKSQGKSLANLDAETQKQLRLQAVITASGITMDAVNKKQADNADMLEQLSVGYERLQVTVGQTTGTALVPLISSVNSMLTALNNVSPTLVGVVGGVGSLGAALITLRVTGLIPALNQVKVFGAELLSLRGALISLSTAGAITAIIYGLGQLADAYNKAKTAQNGFATANKAWISSMKQELDQMNKAQLDYEKKSAEQTQKSLQADINQLKQQIEQSKEIRVAVDNGIEYEYTVETAKTAQLKTQLAIKQQLLDTEKERAVYAEVLLQKEAKKQPLTNDELKKEFEKNKGIIAEQQRHEVAMAEITGQSQAEQMKMRTRHYEQLLKLHRQYGQDTKQISNQIAEFEAANKLYGTMDTSGLAPKMQTTPLNTIKPKGESLDTMGGNDLARLRADSITDANERELEITRIEYSANIDRYKNYENFTEIKKELDLQYSESVKQIEQRKTDTIISNTRNALTTVGGMFGKHTLAYKLTAVATGTWDAIQTSIAVYKSIAAIPIVGPFMAPIIAGVALSAQMANVSKIGSTPAPKMPGYERGGIVVGENGPEVITPMQDYASGQAQLIMAVRTQLAQEQRMSPGNIVPVLERYLSKIESWHREIEFRISGNDLVTVQNQTTEINNRLAIQ